ncbi:hypothetical protein DFR29_11963 [Tahibacter aquaticus]|uniref:Uncharacterized protein n=2 Tax=Tahibacter aquaticus TaxID=520092 RepID=A0A4R6YMN4_9GAMM|nr:hypothetical protein DFR29_11963 [Tahibacter aquaticus]
MDEWLQRLMEGIDPESPDASYQLFLRLMGLVDWWLLFWLTLGCIAVGGLIGWKRGTFWRDVAFAAAFGPFGWILSWLLPPPLPPCRHCGRSVTAKQNFCAHCGKPIASAVATNSSR